jgi:hypothetical protein
MRKHLIQDFLNKIFLMLMNNNNLMILKSFYNNWNNALNGILDRGLSSNTLL